MHSSVFYQCSLPLRRLLLPFFFGVLTAKSRPQNPNWLNCDGKFPSESSSPLSASWLRIFSSQQPFATFSSVSQEQIIISYRVSSFVSSSPRWLFVYLLLNPNRVIAAFTWFAKDEEVEQFRNKIQNPVVPKGVMFPPLLQKCIVATGNVIRVIFNALRTLLDGLLWALRAFPFFLAARSA